MVTADVPVVRCSSCGRDLARVGAGGVVVALAVAMRLDGYAVGACCYGNPATELERGRARAAARMAVLDQQARARTAKAAARGDG